METELSENFSGFQIAILRAFGDEPLIRYVANGAQRVMVRSEQSMRRWQRGEGGENDWIGWPRREIYKYNPQVFERLTLLFQSGKKNELRQAWEEHERLFEEGR